MTPPPGPEPRILVWAVPRDGHTLDRFLLDVRRGRVRLVDPNLRARVLQQLPLVPATLLFLAILATLFTTILDSVAFLAALLGLTILFVAGVVPYSAYIWGFLLMNPRGAFDADVVETAVGNLGSLFLRLRIHHTDPGLASGGGPIANFPEDRWLACRHRKRVLAVFQVSRVDSDPAP